MSDTMTPPSILDLAKAALADRDRGTPGEWRTANGKGTAAVAASDCYVFLNVRTVEVDDCVKRWQEDAAIIAAARTREPLLAAEVVRLTALVERWEALGERHDLALREPGCTCHREQGDSPCSLHAEEER